jgi:hypothetical protein
MVRLNGIAGEAAATGGADACVPDAPAAGVDAGADGGDAPGLDPEGALQAASRAASDRDSRLRAEGFKRMLLGDAAGRQQRRR